MMWRLRLRMWRVEAEDAGADMDVGGRADERDIVLVAGGAVVRPLAIELVE